MSTRPITQRSRSGSSRAASGILMAVAMLMVGLLLPSGASAFGFQTFEAPVQTQANTPETRAGVAPYKVMNAMTFDLTINNAGNTVADGNVKDVIVDLPAGFVGTPNAVAQCDPALVMNFGANG